MAGSSASRLQNCKPGFRPHRARPQVLFYRTSRHPLQIWSRVPGVNGPRGAGGGDVGRGCSKITMDSPRKFGTTTQDKHAYGQKVESSLKATKTTTRSGPKIFSVQFFFCSLAVFLAHLFCSIISFDLSISPGLQIWSLGQDHFRTGLVGQKSFYQNDYQRLRSAGFVCNAVQPNTQPLYRCNSESEHSHSAPNDENCKHMDNREALLGYDLKQKVIVAGWLKCSSNTAEGIPAVTNWRILVFKSSALNLVELEFC